MQISCEKNKLTGILQLGIPTANIPVENAAWIEKAESGVYFGWAGIQLPASHPDLPERATERSVSFPKDTTYPVAPKPPQTAYEKGWRLYPMVMSIGYNPFYKNTVRSAEVHVLHRFEKDFYGSEMRVSILGYIRPEYDYVSVESLIEDIAVDCKVAGSSLDRTAWRKEAEDPYLWSEAETVSSS